METPHNASSCEVKTVHQEEEMGFDILKRNVANVLGELEKNRYRNAQPARLIAVTKTVPPETIQMLQSLRLLDIGENRVQDALKKLTKILPEYRLHWIGRLQTNKVKDIISHLYMLHSLDRLSLAQEVNRRAGMRGRAISALVQVNIAGETQKAGIEPSELKPFLISLKSFSSIQVTGLMAMMPFDAHSAQLTRWFHEMRTMFDILREDAINGISMTELSMGMSNDYMIAAREGATMVRVGTALFRG